MIRRACQETAVLRESPYVVRHMQCHLDAGHAGIHCAVLDGQLQTWAAVKHGAHREESRT